MICQICGKNYIALGVHVKVKHGVELADYRHEFGLLKTAPLVDDELSAHLSRTAKITFATRSAEEQQGIRERCVEINKIATAAPKTLSDVGRAQLSARNSERNHAYIHSKKDDVARCLKRNQFVSEVHKATGVSSGTIRKMAANGLVVYDKEALAAARVKLAVATMDVTRSANIEKVLALYDTDLSTTEICRRVGIGRTTHKRWVVEGRIPSRRTYMKQET